MGAKLIRDKIKDNPNFTAEARRVANEEEHYALLIAKLFEELGEFLAAPGEEAILDELIDVYTVITTIIRMNFNKDKFYQAFEQKFDAKGGFDEGWVMVE